MIPKKIVFQVYANPSHPLDESSLYPFAIKVSVDNDQSATFTDHADYIKGVLNGAPIDTIKYQGIIFDKNPRGEIMSGKDYVLFDPDSYGSATGTTMSTGQTVVDSICKDYAAQNKFTEDYTQKFDSKGVRASYDSIHIHLS